MSSVVEVAVFSDRIPLEGSITWIFSISSGVINHTFLMVGIPMSAGHTRWIREASFESRVFRMVIRPHPEVTFWALALMSSFIEDHFEVKLSFIVRISNLPVIASKYTVVVKVEFLIGSLVAPVSEVDTSLSMIIIFFEICTFMNVFTFLSPNIKSRVREFGVAAWDVNTFSCTWQVTIFIIFARSILTTDISKNFTVFAGSLTVDSP